MTENQALQIFLRLLHREQQEYQDKPEKGEGLFGKIAKRMRNHYALSVLSPYM